MPLNPPKGEMYPGFHTWNPIKGKCEMECVFCFMRTGRLKDLNGYNEPPHLVEKELDTKLGLGKDIFVGSTIDMWADSVDAEWIERVLQHCYEADELASDLFTGMVSGPTRYKGKQRVERFHGKRKSYSRLPNRYLFQSKNPSRFMDFFDFMPANTTVGTTIETNDLAMYRKLGISKAPHVVTRYSAMKFVAQHFSQTMISIEPIMDFDVRGFAAWIDNISPNYVSIGAETKGVFERLGIPQPSHEKVIQLVGLIVDRMEYVEVRLKPNLRHLPGEYSKEEFMDELQDAGGIWPPYEE